MPHSFAESLAMSHAAEDLPVWQEVYEQAFPSMVSMVNHRQDGWWQRAGVDRSVILQSSKQIRIDEKVRGRNKKTGKVYDDIALEWLSSREHNTPGWVCKPLLCDYIAYLIAPLGRCYLLPIEQLQMAWAAHGEGWRNRFFEIKADNGSYTTVSTAVPVDVLFRAIGQQLRLDVSPFEVDE